MGFWIAPTKSLWCRTSADWKDAVLGAGLYVAFCGLCGPSGEVHGLGGDCVFRQLLRLPLWQGRWHE